MRTLPFDSMIAVASSSCCRGVRWRSSGGSSKQWLRRQQRDAFARGDHRSRAYFKLKQLDEKHRLFSNIGGAVVIDLGAAPGGWSEYVASRRQRQQQHAIGGVVAVDLLRMAPLSGVVRIEGDCRDEAVLSEIAAAARGLPVRWVLSDMAPNTSGDGPTDHFRSLDLCMLALSFATTPVSRQENASPLLSPGGGFLCKLFRGCDERALSEAALEAGFAKAQWVKPPASRSESKEVFLLASGFRS